MAGRAVLPASRSPSSTGKAGMKAVAAFIAAMRGQAAMKASGVSGETTGASTHGMGQAPSGLKEQA